MPIKNIKTINGFVYVLFQTDKYKSHNNRIMFGVFDSFEHAHAEAVKNKLKNENADYVIITAKINQFAEH